MHCRCPHCNNPIEIVADSELIEVNCPSCGSSFSLLGNESTAAYKPAPETVGHFELLEQIGMGSFGTVWKAQDTELDRIVAIKIPRKDQLNAAEAEQFLREARSAAQLNHPNIVSVHEVGRDNEQLFIVSDFVQGATLSDWIEYQTLTPREAVELCAKIADSLHHAHEAGVIHRDLKPGNIMMDLDGDPHIMDFGLAKREAGEITMTVEGKVLGTPAYMSPEQARGEAHQADARSDLYSLGVILFQLLTGELPFRGNPRMLIVQILKDEPPRPRLLNNSIPRDLETICLKNLEKSRSRRYATAKQLGDELKRFLASEPIHARPVGTAERLWRSCLRNRVVAALSTAVVLSLLAGIGLSTWFGVRASMRSREATRERDLARRHSYVADVNRAQIALAAGRVGQARDVLARWNELEDGEKDLRRWEWHHLWRLCQRRLRTLSVSIPQSVGGVLFSPDGSRLATGTAEGTVKLWDVATWQEIAVLKANSYPWTFSLDGSLLATETTDGKIKIWRAATGESLNTLEHGATVTDLAFRPNSLQLATAGEDGTIKLWDAVMGTSVVTFDVPAKIKSRFGIDGNVVLAFRPDGGQLASGHSGGTVNTWNVTSGRHVSELKVHEEGPIELVVYSTDGSKLAAMCDTTLNLLDPSSGDLLATLRATTGGAQVVGSGRHGLQVAAGTDEGVVVWDLVRRTGPIFLQGNTYVVFGVAFNSDGSLLASADLDGNVIVWDVLAGRERWLFETNSACFDVAFNPDGSLLACGHNDGTATVWRVSTMSEIVSLRPGINLPPTLQFSPDGARLAGISGNKVQLWDVATGESAGMLKGHTSGVSDMSYSPNGKWIVSGGSDTTVRLWDADTCSENRTLEGHTDRVLSVSFSPDGKRIASGSDDKTVRLWEVTTGKEITSLPHQYELRQVAFAPDGLSLATVSEGGPITPLTLWDLTTRSQLADFVSNTYQAFAFSPNGLRMAFAVEEGDEDDDPIRLWDPQVGREVAKLSGHDARVNQLSFSPDGAILAAACYESGGCTVKLWDGLTGRELGTLRGHSGGAVEHITFSPDGTRLASAGSDRTVKLWDLETGREVASLMEHRDNVQWVHFSPNGSRLASASHDGTIVIRDGSPFTNDDESDLDMDQSSPRIR